MECRPSLPPGDRAFAGLHATRYRLPVAPPRPKPEYRNRNDAQETEPHVAGRLVVAASVALAGFFFYSDTAKDWVEVATEWAETVMRDHPVAGAIVFFVFAALSAILAFATSVVLVPPATEAWGKPLTLALLWGGYMAGAAAAYGIGYMARPLLVRMGYGKELAQYKEFASKRMRFWAVLLFCFAVPSELPAYLFGGVHYSFWKFLLAMGIAEGVFAIGIVVAGGSLLEAEPVQVVVALGILTAIALVAGWVLRKQRGVRK